MSAPEFVYLYGEGDAPPAIVRPKASQHCCDESPEAVDGGCWECGLLDDHDGPHAAFAFGSDRLLAAWISRVSVPSGDDQ